MTHYLKLMICMSCFCKVAFCQLKPIEHKNGHSFLYDNQTTISDRSFISILKSANNSAINGKLKTMRRNKFIRTGIHIGAMCAGIVGSGILLEGVLNSSGRNDFPQQERDQLSAQRTLGAGIMALGASFSLSTVFINIKNHKILHKDLVKLYNQQL